MDIAICFMYLVESW